ncbi:DEKNAAC105574 [Brettanomyces naardenensis]|uniref:DEKNAAC105574 n=1 Tax=Brettanomyces naardenensis TaxID=13370 RepID=A0A448YTR9_BRENA|nr:DEKNAAC105574 [Brettanomyces naardenensis]
MTERGGTKRQLEMASCLHQLDFRPSKKIKRCYKRQVQPNLTFQSRFEGMLQGLNYRADDEFVNDMCSYSDPSQYSTLRFLRVAGQFVFDLGNTNAFRKLLDIEDFLFARTDCELMVPFCQFPLISVAFISGYSPSGTVNTSRTVAGLSHRYFKCRGYQKLQCKATLCLTIDLQQQFVGIKFKEGHSHSITDLHMRFTPSTIRNYIVDYANSDRNFCNRDIRISLHHRIGKGLTDSEKIRMQDRSGLSYMRSDYIKTQVRPIVFRYHQESSGT